MWPMGLLFIALSWLVCTFLNLFFFSRKIIDVSPGETVEQQEYNDRAFQYG